MTGENIFKKNMSEESPRWLHKITVAFTALFFFLLPLQTRFIIRAPIDHGVPYEYGTISVFLVEVIGWVVILLGLIRARRFQVPALSAGGSGFRFQALWLLPIFAFLSIAWAPDKVIALQASVRLLEGILLYVVISTKRVERARGEISREENKYGVRFLAALGMTEWWIFAFLIGAVIQAGLGIYQFLSQSSFASTVLGMALHDPRALGTSVVEFGQERWLRAYGGLPHPNVLGGYLVIALAVAIAMLEKLQTPQRFQRLGVKVLVPIFLAGIFFSFSRAAWIAAVVVIVYWSVRIWKKKNTPAMCHWLLVMIFLLFVTFSFRQLIVGRVSPQSSDRLEVKSRTERVSGLRESWEFVKKHPLIGVGIGNYTQAIKRDVRPGQPLYSYQPAHNVSLLIWVELGIVGLALWAATLYYILKRSKHVILMFCCFAVLLLADHYLWTLPFGILLFWPIFALSTTYKQETS